MSISLKIWLSISALLLGYLITVTVNSWLGLYAEGRLSETSTTLFPATTLSRGAEVDYTAQVQAYQEAVLTGDHEQVQVAHKRGLAVRKDLDELLGLGDLRSDRRALVTALLEEHERYAGAAQTTYLALAQGMSNDQLARAAAELSRQSTLMEQQLADLVAGLTTDLNQELADTVARSVQQRHVSLVVLIAAAGISLTLVYVVISRWTGRLVELMEASGRMARGDFSVVLGRSGSDEIGRLSQSFIAMQGAISARNEDLRHFNEGLEGTIRQRTKELSDRNSDLMHEIEERQRAEAAVQELHNQLLDASRRAGMAEVATGVLHNVGNVLNSVNVSANLIAEHLRDAKVGNVAKVAEMMLAQGDGLGRFLGEDQKGRQLPGYLGKLAEHLTSQQRAVAKEIGSLIANIEHIKEIVQLQQSYGQAVGVIQQLRAQDVVEEALRLNAASLQRHAVEVVRQFDDLPPLPLDRHKILQILVNLITNAQQALAEFKPTSRLITVRLARPPGVGLQFSVQDNGIGIAPENLKHIFSHGFTTKKEGHGFGLHSCANAAKEMQGAMSVQSDGVGLGATFTLTLPVAG